MMYTHFYSMNVSFHFFSDTIVVLLKLFDILSFPEEVMDHGMQIVNSKLPPWPGLKTKCIKRCVQIQFYFGTE